MSSYEKISCSEKISSTGKTSSSEKNLNQTMTFRVVKENGEEIVAGPFPHSPKIVIVINNQFTSAPNTTQIASGAGRNSAAGNNAALDSSNTEQQQSVGANGLAKNTGMGGDQTEPNKKHADWENEEGIVIVINNQTN